MQHLNTLSHYHETPDLVNPELSLKNHKFLDGNTRIRGRWPTFEKVLLSKQILYQKEIKENFDLIYLSLTFD